jgi:hypothetical protein
MHESRGLYHLVHPDLGVHRVSVSAGGDHLGGAVNAAKLAGVNDLNASYFRRSVLYEMILARA